jgi:hypothetical protein
VYIKKTIPADEAQSASAPAREFSGETLAVLDVDSREVAPEPAAPKKGLGGFMPGKKPAQAPAAEPAPPRKSLFSGFKGKSENSTPSFSDAKQGDKPGKGLGGLMAGLGRKEGSAEAPDLAKEKAKAKPKAGKKLGDGAKQIAVLVELEDGRRVCWNVSSSGMEVTELDQCSRALSFSPRDLRYATEGPMSAGAAQALVLSEIGEDARTINTSKTLGAVYGTSAERAKVFGDVSVGPGLLVLDALLHDAASVEDDRILGLQLLDTDGSIGLVVLHHFKANGDVDAPQVTVNPSDLSFVLAQFVSSRRLDPDKTKVVLVKNDDLLSGLSNFKAYPTQASLLGLPVSKLLSGAAVVSLALAAGSLGYAGYGYTLKESSTGALSRATSAKTQALAQADGLLTSSVVSFSRTQALDLGAAMATANLVWVPGSIVQMDATVQRVQYAVRMPMLRGSDVGGRPSVLDRTAAPQLDALLKFPAPENCSKSILNLSGALNAAQITVECENGPGRLSTYFLE